MRISSVLASALLLATPLSIVAQHSYTPGTAAHGHKAAGETHAHASPHGGTVRTAGKYHLELVQQAGQLQVYLLDDNEKTLPVTRATGTAMLLSAAGKTSSVKLLPTGNHLVAAVPAGLTLRTAIVSLNANGSSLSARFEKIDSKAKAGKVAAAAYACLMNCEGSASTNPGSCPKCGMALVKKS
ncbi:heavy metal-binding domain-containing protein [Hymenobacter yonginensis]|uniref:Heavy metal-binding domain-containing protein n=1 Tax=Hymenobacter yonginensis TaxID=748197 RepID=A0ABY7PV54_9BACT|nr:heavy metal-binding domain-containing protein [Hymenobacter yonginensis]WBO86791.1 heavy metal-binding domain-containing protein [Hymenobacter yonginensis]